MADIAGTGRTTSTVYLVEGMTCDHCAASVTEEVGDVTGVTDVHVDLPTGRVTVTSGGPVDDTRIREAVDEAGYELKGRL